MGERLRTGKEKLQSKVNSTERTTEGANLQEEKKHIHIHPYEKESGKCEAYRFFVAYKNTEGNKAKRLMFGKEGAQYSS